MTKKMFLMFLYLGGRLHGTVAHRATVPCNLPMSHAIFPCLLQDILKVIFSNTKINGYEIGP